eukprot:828794-Rhodomonas_salina.1
MLESRQTTILFGETWYNSRHTQQRLRVPGVPGYPGGDCAFRREPFAHYSKKVGKPGLYLDFRRVWTRKFESGVRAQDVYFGQFPSPMRPILVEFSMLRTPVLGTPPGTKSQYTVCSSCYPGTTRVGYKKPPCSARRSSVQLLIDAVWTVIGILRSVVFVLGKHTAKSKGLERASVRPFAAL